MEANWEIAMQYKNSDSMCSCTESPAASGSEEKCWKVVNDPVKKPAVRTAWKTGRDMSELDAVTRVSQIVNNLEDIQLW
jgi:hypothetical protein